MRSMPGCEVVSYKVQVDHIYMVMVIPPRYAVSDVIGRLKGKTASRMRKKFDWLQKCLLERERGVVTRVFCFDGGR